MASLPVAEARQAAAGLLAQRVAGLDEPAALAVLQRARAWHSQAIYELHDHLAAEPDALTSGASACPLSLVRVIHLLIDAGHSGLVAPRCVRCGRARRDMPAVRERGRICLPCYRQATKAACARCGRRTRACHRRDEGLICRSCRDAEPAARGVCPACGRERPLRRGRGGSVHCDSCAPRPAYTCAGCGTVAPASAITSGGPLCRRCHQKFSARPCGRCGKVRQVEVKATDEHPDLCASCRPRTMGTCAGCGRHTYINRRDRGHGDPICQACQPKIERECALCGRSSYAQAFWPVGPVCRDCYGRARQNPARCNRCGQVRVLTGADPERGPICGRCAGAKADYLCRRCGQGGRLYSDGMCDRCVLDQRVDDLLGVGGAVADQLAPLGATLKRAQRADASLVWLRTSPTARLLGKLAAGGAAISHELLDGLTQDQALHSLRHLLVRAGVLPERAEYLERIGPWLAELLKAAPTAHAMLVRPYCRWFLLHRARRRAATRGLSPAASYHLRGHIRTVLAFLAWLDEHGRDLATAEQSDIDAWLVEGAPSQRYGIRQFLTWASRHGLAVAPTTPADKPGRLSIQPLDDQSLWEQLHRCLHDDQLPLDMRVAGALVLLYGIQPGRLVKLTTDDVTCQDQGVQLRAGRKPILLSQPVGNLVRQLAESPNELSNVPYAGEDRPRFLFPGKATSGYMRASAMRNRLLRYGIAPGPGRDTALLALAEDLPAPIVADLLGLKHETAIRWAGHSARDWADYLAARDTDPQP